MGASLGACVAIPKPMRVFALLAAACSACTVGSVLEDGGGGGGTGQLTITATTTEKGAQYRPKNYVAVWIEKADGTAVKTIQRWGDRFTAAFVAWKGKTGGDTDAVSGATRQDHATPLSIDWKLKDRNQQVVPDGTYTIRMELADGNSTTVEQNNEGTFTFVKGPQPQMQSGLSNGGFTNVTIQFTPPAP